MLLTYLDPAYVRFGVGVLLVVYGIYGLAKPALKPRKVGTTTDGGIGFLNGVLCGLTGLPGFIITVWCQMRGWNKDEQRAVFQPVMLAAMMMIAISLSVTGAITAKRSNYMYSAFRRCWPGCGSDSSATASSTTPRSARWS